MVGIYMIKSIEEGRKEDGNRSIADKIKKRLHNLDKTVENNQGRWAWELLQNAKDSIADYPDRKISIQIELDANQVIFRHNGVHFTEKDIRGLINQISSKEVEEGEQTKRTGRFGTGFLTTHLLSKVIDISGIVETNDFELFRFQFPLDREGNSISQLVPKIENAWQEFHNSTTQIHDNYELNSYNTSFKYHLNSDEQKKIARAGTEEFMQLIPFVLTFIPNIDKVEIIDNVENETLSFTNPESSNYESIFTIEKDCNGTISQIFILYASNEKVTIAAEVEKQDDNFIIKSHKNVPKLFCDFPLVGTESFHFPIIVNSFYFNPQIERDGIWLKGSEDPEVKENQSLLEEALELYKTLLDKVSSQNFNHLFNMANSKMPETNEKYFDEYWYSENIQDPLRIFLLQKPIIELENNSTEKKLPKDVWFPSRSYSKEIQKKLWKYTYDLYDEAVCKESHIQDWVEVYWSDWHKIDYEELAKDIEKQESIQKLSETLDRDETETFVWYNEVCKFLLEVETNIIYFQNRKMLPNRKGVFKLKKNVFIDKIKEDKLISILALLGSDWENLLLHSKVGFGSYQFKEKKDIAIEISDYLKNPSLTDENVISAISLLSGWFETNHKEAKEIMPELYRKKAQLFMNTILDKESLYKVMRSKTDIEQLAKVAKALEDDPNLLQTFNQAEKLSMLLRDYNVSSLEELKTVLENSNTRHQKAEITQEDLAGLGVTSMDELEEALKDKDLAALFNHTSRPNANMFLYAQQLIERSKQNIIEHLKSHPGYDCTDIDELATTVLGGIKKNGVDVHIVVRPSDNGQVIVFYSSEKDTLDYANAELWIDNGRNTPKHLTLGTILKTTGINKIPV